MPDNSVEVRGVGFTLRATQTHPLWDVLRHPIAEVRRRTQDLTIPFRDFQPKWFENEKIVFEAQGIPMWPALSPAYAQRKAAIAPGKPMMRFTDRLVGSLTGLTADTVYEVGPRRLVMGTTVEYSAMHQQGGSRLPARPHVVLLPQTFDELNTDVWVYVVNPFGGR